MTARPQPVRYTESNTQVADNNVSEVFARGNTIEGSLRQEPRSFFRPGKRTGRWWSGNG